MRELLLGCGRSREKRIGLTGASPGWSDLTTLDYCAECEPDVIHDLNVLPYPFDDAEFDEIYAFCVLEHCGRQGDWRFFFDQWTEFYRIAKPAGYFFGIVPKFDSPWAWGDPSHTRVIMAESLVFLCQDRYLEIDRGSPMSDFRWYYKANWNLLHFSSVTEHQNGFVLQRD